MPGHMQQRGPSCWRLHAFIGKDSNGRRRYASRTFHGTKKEAGTALAAFVTEVAKDKSTSSATEQITVSQTLEKWLDSRRAQLSPATTDRYRVAIKHIEPVLGPMRVARLRPHHIEDLYSALVAQGQSGSSIRKIHWALRQSLAWAHRRGYSSVIATDAIQLPPLGAREIEPPSSADVRTVIDYLLNKDLDWGTLVAVIAWTGCRRGEVAGLRWEDVDMVEHNLLIRRAVAAVPGGIQVKGTKTGDIRRIAIGPRTVKLLKARRRRAESRAKGCGAAISPSAYIFSPDPESRRPYNPYTITRTFVVACKSAGIPPIRLHDLRHHSATTLLKGGASVGEVMDRHGWR
ncbi:MAG TPA: site-specific integrase, partial [Acidimicrobiales bacterium]|nr:site-specific integrase [Acidimicrobiales bacterium]